MPSAVVEANVTDLDNQPVAGTVSVTVYGSAIQIGLEPAQQTIDVGTSQRIRVLALREDGRTPAAGQVVHIGTYRRIYSNSVVQNADGTVSQQDVAHDTLLRALTLRTDRHGLGTFALSAPVAGEYHLAVSAYDPYGNRATSETEIYVGGGQPIALPPSTPA